MGYTRLLERKYAGKKYELIREFGVLHRGWECDHTGWVFSIEGQEKPIVVLTNHGNAYEASVDELVDLVRSYQKIIAETEKAIECLEN